MSDEELNTVVPDWWDELTEDQIRHINQGVDDAEKGRLVSSEEFWKKLKDA